MAVNLEEVLKSLGWTDGFQIPIANADNKLLEEELAQLSLRKQKAKTALDIASTRFDGLSEHLKYVQQENEQTQKLITAHNQQLETLENSLYTTKAENQNASRSIRATTNELKDAEAVQNERKNELQKLIVKAERLKIEMDWDSEALKAWEEALKKRDEDIDLLKKFFEDDDRKFNQLEAKRQRLRAELVTMQAKVAKMATNTFNAEQMIERSGKGIKQLSNERDTLIDRWKDTVKMLQQRDNDIMRVQEQLCNMHEVLAKEQEKLSRENKFLANQQKNNKELEMEIREANNVNTKYRKELGEMYQYLLTSSTELDTLKRQMSSIAHDLKNERLKLKRLEEQYEEKTNFCQQFSEDMKHMEAKLEEVQNSAMSSEERIKRIEAMIEQEEKLHHMTLIDIEKINGELFRSEQILTEQTNIGRNLEIDINLATCTTNHLRKHIQAERKDLDRIKEVVYEMEYRIDECERKLLEISEAKNQEVPEEIQMKIQELEKSLAEHTEVQHSLQSQVDRLREEMRRLASVITADKEVLESLQNKCENFLLIYDIGQKQIATARRSVQEKQVEENMMKLRISHVEKDKKKEEKQIFNLEKFRLNLEQAMKERQIDINTQKQILMMKKRNLEEDKGRLKGDVAIRKLKIEQYQKKYHLAVSGLGKDEDGQSMSVTHFKIKNAQEKFFLQQEGDILDQKIKTAEKEIVALENTLKIVNLTNASFKNSLAPVKDTDPEVEELNALEEELQATFAELKIQRIEFNKYEAELEATKKKLKDVEEELHANEEELHYLDEEIQMVKKQELDKEEKLKRVEGELKRLQKQLKNKSKKELYKYNRDFEIRHLQDTNKKVLSQLRELSLEYPDMAPVVGRYMVDNNLELPDHRLTPSTNSTMSIPSTVYDSEQCNTNRTNMTTGTTVSEKSQVSVTKVNLALGI